MSTKLTKFEETFLIENNTKTFRESEAPMKAILPKIEAIHAGITKNFVQYTAEALSGDFDKKTGVFSWTSPYPKPVLTNHDIESEPLGRVVDAKFSADSTSGKACITISPAITDQTAIEKILDNRYLTVSIGCSAKAAYCSICGIDVAQNWCDHYRGEKYEVDGKEKTCYWTLEDIEFYEVSFVNRPADENAMVVSTEWMAFDGDKFLDQDNNHFGLEEMANKGFDNHILVQELFKEDTKGGKTVKLEELKAELTKANEQLKQAKDQVSALEADKETLTADKEALTGEVSQLTEEKTQLEKEVEDLKTAQQTMKEELDSVKQEMTALVEENTNSFAAIQSKLVEYAAAIKKFVDNKTDEETEEIKADLKTRSLESLENTIKDLLDSLTAIRRERQEIDNPALSGSNRINDNESLTDEDIVYSLLSGRKLI